MDKNIYNSSGSIVGQWDGEDARQLRDMLDSLENDGHEIDFSSLPSYNISDEVALYPVWAVDANGLALVGEDARQFEDYNKIVADYLFNKF